MIDFNELIITGRGSSALFTILQALEVENKSILLPVNICEIIYPIVHKAGFIPIFYDVDANNGNATLDTIQSAYSGKETVLLAVHNFGAPLPIQAIVNWAKSKSIFVIEDICNSLGAKYQNQALGSWGDAAILSFGYAKILENEVGGAAIVKNKNIRNNVARITSLMSEFNTEHRAMNEHYQFLIRSLRNSTSDNNPKNYLDLYFKYVEYLMFKISSNEKMKIETYWKKLDEIILKRKEIANIYRQNISNKLLTHIDEIPGQIYWRYNLLIASRNRDKFIDYLRNNDVLISAWYPPIDSLFENKCIDKSFAGARSFGERVINLFVDHRISSAQAIKTTQIINEFKL